MWFQAFHGARIGTSLPNKRYSTLRKGSDYPLLLHFIEVPLLLGDLPLSTFVSVGSALSFAVQNSEWQSRSKGNASKQIPVIF
jgi:hypothetical protein